MSDGRTTVFLSYYRTEDVSAFAYFARQVEADAKTAPGYRAFQMSITTSPVLEQAMAVHFADESSAHAWLDLAAPMLNGKGFLRSGLELFVDDAPRAPWVLLVREVVAAGKEEAFVETAERLAELESARAGYEGSSVFPPADGEETWATVVRFRREQHVTDWLASPELGRVLPEREAQVTGGSQVTTATSFASTVRVADGKAQVTPEWKTAMIVLLVIYPAAILLTKFLNPWLFGVVPQPWLALFINMVITVVLLTWVLMPVSARLLRRWLDPVATRTTTLWGTIGVCAGYAVLLTIFSAVGIS